jgi:hypothetical protein
MKLNYLLCLFMSISFIGKSQFYTKIEIETINQNKFAGAG